MEHSLLVIDVQNDFFPGGAVPVPEALEVVLPISTAASAVARAGGLVVATRHWHPAKRPRTVGATGGGRPAWPSHCVEGTRGVAHHPALHLPGHAAIVTREPGVDEGDSAFPARDDRGRTVAELLRAAGARRIIAGGLLLERSVRATVIDALEEGFEVFVLLDAVRALDPRLADAVLEELAAAGAQVVSTGEVVMELYGAGEARL